MVSTHYYSVSLQLPRRVGRLSREDWIQLASQDRRGFLGATEGVAQPGSRILDLAEAPRDRDLVGDLEMVESCFYFDSPEAAKAFGSWVTEEFDGVIAVTLPLSKEAHQDWNRVWRQSFQGVTVDAWRIVPAWEALGSPVETDWVIRINPSFGFGSGTHPTTQLCLSYLARGVMEGKAVLDFGSGSGILAVAAAKRGARVTAIEIDPLALESCRETIKVNECENQVAMAQSLEPARMATFDLVVANILSCVLLDSAPLLSQSLKPAGEIFLSGLMQEDLAAIEETYLNALGPSYEVRFFEKEGWWAAHILNRC